MSQTVNNGDHDVENVTIFESDIVDAAGGQHIPDFVDLALAGLDERELARILKLRQGYQDGSINEQTSESRRLAFAKWLLENGRLKK